MDPEQLAKSTVKAKRISDAAEVARQLAESPSARMARKGAESQTAKLAQKLTESPNVRAATEAAESQSAKLARKLTESPNVAAAKQAAGLGEDLAAIRQQLGLTASAGKASASPLSVTELSPQLRAAIAAKRRSPILPSSASSPPPVVSPAPQKIDTEGLFQRAKEILTEGDKAKRELDLKMVETMEGMHATLVESNDRELTALDRAQAAEAREAAARERAGGRERWMLRMTAGALIFGALTVAAAVVTIIVTLNAGS